MLSYRLKPLRLVPRPYINSVMHIHTHIQCMCACMQTSLVPQTILKDWAEKTFVTNTDYWTFRKQVCTHENCAWSTGGSMLLQVGIPLLIAASLSE